MIISSCLHDIIATLTPLATHVIESSRNDHLLISLLFHILHILFILVIMHLLVFRQQDLYLCMLSFAITFIHRNRFFDVFYLSVVFLKLDFNGVYLFCHHQLYQLLFQQDLLQDFVVIFQLLDVIFEGNFQQLFVHWILVGYLGFYFVKDRIHFIQGYNVLIYSCFFKIIQDIVGLDVGIIDVIAVGLQLLNIFFELMDDVIQFLLEILMTFHDISERDSLVILVIRPKFDGGREMFVIGFCDLDYQQKNVLHLAEIVNEIIDY